MAVVRPVVFPEVQAIKVPKSVEGTPAPAGRTDGPRDGGFEKLVEKAIDRVDGDIKEADRAVERFLAGKLDIQQMALAMERADLALRLFTRMRNRIIDAYQQISRMNI